MKIAVLVSGGVDSSVALKLLLDQGHDVTAFYLKIWLEDELSFLGECPWEEDLKYVERLLCHTWYHYRTCCHQGNQQVNQDNLLPFQTWPLAIPEYWKVQTI